MSKQRAARPSGPWPWRHKVITLLGLLLVLGSCGVAVTVEGDTGDGVDVGVMVDDDVAPETPSEAPTTDTTAEDEPTPQDRWRAAYESNETPYLVAAAGVLGLDELSGDASDFTVGTCQELLDAATIERRVGRVVRELALPDGSFPTGAAVIAVTAEHVCPDLSGVHQAQVTARTEAVAEARRVAARERRQAAAAERRRTRERERQAQEERDAVEESPVDVYYENCTAVEAAGAAPIYAGDPGYSGELDRDGDGVACEQ